MHFEIGSQSDGKFTNSTEYIGENSVTQHYISSELDAMHEEDAQCSELCEHSRQPCPVLLKSHDYGSMADCQLRQHQSQIPHQNTIWFDLHSHYHCDLKIIEQSADKYY